MKTVTASGVLACLAVLASGGPAAACGYGMPTLLARYFRADTVAVGRVTALEEQPVKVSPQPGAERTLELRVAVVEVTRRIKGADKGDRLRVGLYQHQTLAVGQESCFLLVEHFQEPLFVLDEMYEYPLDLRDGTQKETVRLYEEWARLLADPQCGLTSRNFEERYVTAALLLAQKRLARGNPHKAPAFDAERSRLILEALTHGEIGKWYGDRELLPARAFFGLGLTEKDGWAPEGIATTADWQLVILQWLNENAETYLIK
jgi:hypothetical protein